MSDYKESEREELLRYVEELQDQNEELISQVAGIKSERQQTISELSSQISMLKKATQEKSGKITELKSQVEGMAKEKKENDWIRQENEDLTSQNRDLKKSLQDVRKEAKAEVDRVRFGKNSEIYKLKSQMSSDSQEFLNIYQELRHGYWIITGALGIYGLSMSILAIWKSAYIADDLAAIPGIIGSGLLCAWSWIIEIAGHVAGLTDKIPVEILAVTVYWILMIIFGAVIIAVITAIIMLARKGFAWYRKWHSLTVAGIVILCVLLLSFFAGEEIRYAFF